MPSVPCPKCGAVVTLPDRPVSKTVCVRCKYVFPVRPTGPPVPKPNPGSEGRARPAPRPVAEIPEGGSGAWAGRMLWLAVLVSMLALGGFGIGWWMNRKSEPAPVAAVGSEEVKPVVNEVPAPAEAPVAAAPEKVPEKVEAAKAEKKEERAPELPPQENNDAPVAREEKPAQAPKNPPAPKRDARKELLQKLFPGGVPEKFVTAGELIQAYKENEVAADRMYGGRFIEVVGTARKVGKDILGKEYLILSSGRDFELVDVQCFFEPGWDLANVQSKYIYRVQGVVSGKSFNVLMKGCRFVTQREQDDRQEFINEKELREKQAKTEEAKRKREAMKAEKVRKEAAEKKRREDEEAQNGPGRKLKLAKALLDDAQDAKARGDTALASSLKEKARARLKEVAETFPDTAAGKEAKELLSKLNG